MPDYDKAMAKLSPEMRVLVVAVAIIIVALGLATIYHWFGL